MTVLSLYLANLVVGAFVTLAIYEFATAPLDESYPQHGN